MSSVLPRHDCASIAVGFETPCFARSFEFLERLGIPPDQLVR